MRTPIKRLLQVSPATIFSFIVVLGFGSWTADLVAELVVKSALPAFTGKDDLSAPIKIVAAIGMLIFLFFSVAWLGSGAQRLLAVRTLVELQRGANQSDVKCLFANVSPFTFQTRYWDVEESANTETLEQISNMENLRKILEHLTALFPPEKHKNYVLDLICHNQKNNCKLEEMPDFNVRIKNLNLDENKRDQLLDFYLQLHCKSGPSKGKFWSHQQLFRSIQAFKSLKAVILTGTVTLERHKVNGDVDKGSFQDLPFIKSLIEIVCPDIKVFVLPNRINTNDDDDASLIKAVNSGVKYAREITCNGQRFDDKDICIDITGGMSNWKAHAVTTTVNQDIKFSYVDTNSAEVRVYDSHTPDASFKQ